MATMRTRRLGWTIAAAAALLSVRPFGPLERVVDLALVPARLVGGLGTASLWTASDRPQGADGRAAGSGDLELDMSRQLELAVLRSAEPRTVPWPIEGVVPIPGEVDVSEGMSRDRVSLRVSDPGPVQRGQAVVAGDVFVGTVEKIPVREPYRDRPGLFEQALRRLRLSAPPVKPAKDLVIVRLITDPAARVGAQVLEDEEGARCRMVVGGLERMDERVWLAVHNPERQTSSAGRVRVHEPASIMESADAAAEGFLLGDLRRTVLEATERTPRREVLGVEPLLDFEAGLNQVLVLTPGSGSGVFDPGAADVVGVLEDDAWRPAELQALGDLCPWRSTARLGVGRDGGVLSGAAVVDGVRLVGRVSRSDQIGATVALLDDPGFRVSALAQPADEPGAPPLVLGELESAGRDGEGRLVLRWRPASGSRHAAWLERHSGGGGRVQVRLWTGSGMQRVPRGLLIGSAVLEGPEVRGGAVLLALTGTGAPGAGLRVRTGGARLARPERRGVVRAAEVDR